MDFNINDMMPFQNFEEEFKVLALCIVKGFKKQNSSPKIASEVRTSNIIRLVLDFEVKENNP